MVQRLQETFKNTIFGSFFLLFPDIGEAQGGDSFGKFSKIFYWVPSGRPQGGEFTES